MPRSALERDWKEENVEYRLYSRRGGFCEEAKERLGEHIPGGSSVIQVLNGN